MVDGGDEEDVAKVRVNGTSDFSRRGTTKACAALRDPRKLAAPK